MPAPGQFTEEFDRCVQQVMEQGHEKGSAIAICTTTFQKAGKQIHIGEAANVPTCYYMQGPVYYGGFSEGKHKVYGQAIHPMKTVHPDEDIPERVYLEEELRKAAETLTGKHFGLDHWRILPEPNVITKSYWKDGAVHFEGTVDDEIAELIKNNGLKGVSVEVDWMRPGGSLEWVNGVAPKNFELSNLHFLRYFNPGDPKAFVRVAEAHNRQYLLEHADKIFGDFEKKVDYLLRELAEVKREQRNFVRIHGYGGK